MRYLITHGHIFKNAGSTFDHALEKAFGESFLDHRDDEAMRQGGAKYLNQLILDNPELKAISSHHLCNPLPVSSNYTCLPVYFIRHPIERIISVYSFERRQNGETPGAVAAAKYDLLDYIKWRFDSERQLVISNYQVAYIGAQRLVTPQKPAGAKELKNCIQKHQSGHCFFGIVDEFDESFRRYREFIAPFFPDMEFAYEIQNVTSRSSFRNKLRAATLQLEPVLDLLYAMNAYDMALYDYVKAAYAAAAEPEPEPEPGTTESSPDITKAADNTANDGNPEEQMSNH